MNLLEKTKQICQDNNIKPVRSRGQNFLISEDAYDFIVDSANLSPDENVLEVGPGLGFLTEKIAKKVKKLIAIELDDVLVDILRNRLDKQGIQNVEVVNENVLDVFPVILSGAKNPEEKASDTGSFGRFASQDDRELGVNSYKIIANLPYNITSIFLRKFLSAEIKPKTMTLILQKEVAERITAKPGKMSLLAVSVQFYADAEILKYIPKSDFWPVPEVDSAVIQLRIKTPSLVIPAKAGISRKAPDSNNARLRPKKQDTKAFFRLVKIGFSSKRKMLKNNLASGYHKKEENILKILENCNFNLKIRAQELSLDDWFKLFGEIKRNVL